MVQGHACSAPTPAAASFKCRASQPASHPRIKPSDKHPCPLPLPLPLAQVKAYTGAEELAAALKGCELVVIPAGVPRKPGMTRDDLFNINAGI
jgi:hypothetical protein